ncbi:MAG: hypothetical protein ABIJ09_15085 [Pseudomonadota bacterium]
MSEAQIPARGGRIKLLVITILVVGLIGVIAYLAGQLNAHRYYLVHEERALVIYRGASIPLVTRPFVPINEDERTAYAPIIVPARWDGSKRLTFNDRSELDRGIYQIIDKRLREEFYGGRGPSMERIDTDMKRVQALSGLSDDDRRALAELQGDYAFLKAREIVDGLPERLRHARRLCDQAEDQGTGKLGDPRDLSLRLAQWMRMLSPEAATAPIPAAAAESPLPPALPFAPPALPSTSVQPRPIPENPPVAPEAPAPLPVTP